MRLNSKKYQNFPKVGLELGTSHIHPEHLTTKVDTQLCQNFTEANL